jgi:hemin uptake protein HemP
MPAPQQPSSVFCQSHTEPSPALHSAENPLPAVDSHALLQGQKTVAIHHNGTLYRLQATRLGKLILTK